MRVLLVEDQSKLARPEDVAPALADLCSPGETRHGQVVRRIETRPA